MRHRILVVLMMAALLAVAAPCLATPEDPEDRHVPLNQDFSDPDGTGYSNCWECVPSVSVGFKCMRENIGFHGCARTTVFRTTPDGGTTVEYQCSVVPYGFCVTVVP